MSETKAYRLCPLCEATCGLEITADGRQVNQVRGDKEDVFSEGYICPKGASIAALDADADRLNTPMVREGKTWRSAGWDEAFALIDKKLTGVISEHGKNAVGAYLGNPTVHNTSLSMYMQGFLRMLGTQNLFSASTVDQIPRQLVAAAVYGTGLSVSVPDLDRCQYLVIMGGNPLVSNGSMMTAPNVGERLKRIRKRGGKIVVIDPRVTETAKAADEHLFIRPGTDAYFLFGVVHTLFEEGLGDPGQLAKHIDGLEEVRSLAKGFSPEVVATRCGIPAEDIRRIARELAAADSAATYVRIGASTQEFGTLANWLPEVIQVLTGNLDREGGTMFTRAAHGPGNTKGASGSGRGLKVGRRTSRVQGRPEIFGEFPISCISEEIETPGEGQIRAMITVAGNPVLSTPNGPRLAKALNSLDFMVSFDIYLNETTQYADVILPGVSPLERCQYNFAFEQLSIRNHARFSPQMFPVPEGQISEWESVLRLTGIISGMGPNADTAVMDDMTIQHMIQREVQMATSPVHGRDADEILKALEPRRGPERIIDFMVRTGPYGDGFGKNSDGLTLKTLEENPHGIDLGPLKPRIPEVLRTPSGKIEIAPKLIVDDVERLQDRLSAPTEKMVLIGRRHLRSNNSWMHNIQPLMTGKSRCTLWVNPEDAEALGLSDGGTATIRSTVGSVTAPVEVTSDIMSGVVSLPHGWGHDQSAAQMNVANANAGVNCNILIDEQSMDIPSGNAVLCGVPVEISPAPEAESKEREAVAAK